MELKYLKVVLNFIAVLTVNIFVVIPFLGLTLLKNVTTDQNLIISLLLTIIVLQLWLIESRSN